jgi:glycerol-3-phosphate acyltransferase PlsY
MFSMAPIDWLPFAMAGGGYMLGSVPFGIVVAKCLGTTDPRTAGSRNIGFTNVLRLSGTKAGLLTLVGDMGKGWIVAWAGVHTIDHEAWVLAVAASPVIGHLYSVFLGFHGGKGVATALGTVLGVAPTIGAAMLGVWFVVAAIWRYSSAAAIAALVVLPLVAAARGPRFQIFASVLAAMILWRHKDNMVRLWNGTETKIGQRTQTT